MPTVRDRTKSGVPGVWGLIALALPLAVYLRTLCPTIYTGDSGELVTGAYSLGIVHPPGYPLYCLLGRLFTLLPVGGVAHRLNFFSALCAAFSSLLLYELAIGLMARSRGRDDPGRFSVTLQGGAALLAGLLCAFSRTLWSQAVVSEVYAFNLLLLLVALVSLRRWQSGSEGRYLILFAFVFGLSVAHHPTALLAAPAILFFLIRRRRWLFDNWSFPLVMPALFLLGLTVYLYLPLRAGARPPLDWGHPVDLSGLWEHITRASYGSLSKNPRSWGLLGAQVRAFLSLLGRQLGPAFGLLGLVGCFSLARRSRDWFWTTVILMLTFGIGLIALLNFPVTPRALFLVRVFLIPAFALMALWIGLGFWWLGRSIAGLITSPGSGGRRVFGVVLGCLLPVLAIVPLKRNFTFCDHSGQHQARDLGRNILATLEPGAILFTGRDTPTFSVAHARIVEGLRPDVSIQHTARADIFRWLTPRPIPLDPGRRPIYGTSPDELPDLTGWDLHGVGLLYQFRREPMDTPSLLDVWSNYRMEDLTPGGAREDFFLVELVRNYAAARGNLAQELVRRGEHRLALREAGAAAQMDTAFYGGYLPLGNVYFQMGEYGQAIESFQRAHRLAPHRAGILENLALSHSRMEQYDRAIELYLHSLALEPRRAGTFHHLGLVYKQAGQYEDAAEAYQRAIDLDPGYADPVRNLGVLYAYHLNDPGRAVRLWGRYLDLRPDDPDREAIEAEMERIRRFLTSGTAVQQKKVTQGAEGQ